MNAKEAAEKLDDRWPCTRTRRESEEFVEHVTAIIQQCVDDALEEAKQGVKAIDPIGNRMSYRNHVNRNHVIGLLTLLQTREAPDANPKTV